MAANGIRRRRLVTSSFALAAFGIRLSGAATLAGLKLIDYRGRRRVILVSAAQGNDPNLQDQRRFLASWAGAENRDVTVVEIVGDRISNVLSDDSVALRSQYELPEDHFSVLLIGKDGSVKLRSRSPVTGETFEHAIDAMPMRKAGER